MRLLIVTLILAMSNIALANQEKDAIKNVVEATVKHFKIDKMVGDTLYRLERNYINEETRKYGSYTVIAANTIIKKQISFEWKF